MHYFYRHRMVFFGMVKAEIYSTKLQKPSTSLAYKYGMWMLWPNNEKRHTKAWQVFSLFISTGTIKMSTKKEENIQYRIIPIKHPPMFFFFNNCYQFFHLNQVILYGCTQQNTHEIMRHNLGLEFLWVYIYSAIS